MSPPPPLFFFLSLSTHTCPNFFFPRNMTRLQKPSCAECGGGSRKRVKPKGGGGIGAVSATVLMDDVVTRRYAIRTSTCEVDVPARRRKCVHLLERRH